MKDNQPKSLRTLKSYVDKLGKLKAQIRELEEEVAVLRTEILNSEQDKHNDKHSFVISTSQLITFFI